MRNPFYLWDYDDITPEAAEVLVNADLGEIDLSTIDHISSEVASILGQYKGKLLLDGLEDIEISSLEEITERSWSPSQWLCLDGLTHITSAQAKALGSFRGCVSLCGLKNLTHEAAEELSKGKFRHICLDGLELIDHDQLQILFAGNFSVGLQGLKFLPNVDENFLNEAITIFNLSLPKLVEIASDTLAVLAGRCDGDLCLNGLKRLPQDDLTILDHCWAHLFLDGLEDLTDIEAEILGKRFVNGLSLTGLKNLTKKQAMFFACGQPERSWIDLGLVEIEEEVALELFKIAPNVLIMDRLKYLSPACAKMCAANIYESFSFNSLESVSDETFHNLVADYSDELISDGWVPGNMELNGIKKLSPAMMDSLANTPNEVKLNGLELNKDEMTLLLEKGARCVNGYWTGKANSK